MSVGSHWIALAIGLAVGGCNAFETVGILGPDAAGAVATGTEAGAPAVDASAVRVAIDECEGASAALLTGTAQPSITWLYPYDGTVFPGGLTAPLLMWSDGATSDDLVYIHMFSSAFDYRGCMKPTAAGQLQLSQQAWSIAGTLTTGAADPFTLELRVQSGGQVLASPTRQVVLATGTLQGSVYYMTVGAGLGSIQRVEPGQSAQPVVSTVGCVGCHSVSAQGSRLVANDTGATHAYALQAGSTAVSLASAPGGESPGITPDGALYLASAHPTSAGPKTYGAGLATASLFETMTGTQVSNSGIPTGAMVPAFSPDGSLLVFNDYAISSGKGLALMDFSETARMASNYRVLVSDTPNYPAWPSFTPDSEAVVFQLGASSDFTAGGAGIVGLLTPGTQSDLFVVDTTSHAVTALARAGGFATAADMASNNTYLPFGTAEAHQNYSPSVSPATSGGYAWMFFDSMRHYGNAGLMRGIWGAAIDVASDGTYASDPSHPAFFLPGQQLGSGNFRAVAALGP